ncbi:Rieske (2Fe-2S) protein [Streptomyces sp. H10-C2]|uniref:Rieske (2Fe-2S) protein n=1 Tax=unclassified Streptomyces TaxID=2593676 RepID=UPI0024BAFB2A|nr:MULTISPECIES: Rieske (2Fe-2S) protein [unclassified Streptomyces]MDJ0343065.1 Rieske (2Fe-2S) protein [Streptomyces sp. PH10-H1]MDJ0372755.1 Rieske (2Fe-2S) protein [Streptomyces sp. H10-C2]
MTDTSGIPVAPTRRTMVAAAGGVGLIAALSACGGSDSPKASDSKQTTTPPSESSAPDPSATTGGGDGGASLAKTADIPVGGGKIFADQKVVVTQPTAGDFKAFSSICTHQGCAVSEVADGTINCPCHGSKYHIADGSVANGPATKPLAAAKVTVSSDSLKLG